MNLKKYMIYLLPLAFVACEPEFDDVKFEAGAADFSRTVAVGNSLTAGFQSNALSAEGQINSLPNIVATQLKIVGGGEFKQAILPGETGEKGAGVNEQLYDPRNPLPDFLLPELKLVPTMDCLGASSVGPGFVPAGFNQPPGFPVPVPNSIYSAAEFDMNVSADGPFNNYGIPGAKVEDMNSTTFSLTNPYYKRMAAANETVVQAAVRANPTFFMLWIGNNDVLGYATQGGDDGTGSITAQGTFDTEYKKTLDALSMTNTVKGVVANIPNVTSIPYFSTIPTGTDAITQANADTLMLLKNYGGYNAGLAQAAAANPAFQAEADMRKIEFKAGQLNPFVVVDPSLTAIPGLPMYRQIKAGEYLILTTPSDSLKCAQWGTAKPIPGSFHLTTAELGKIQTAIDGYNATIRTEASARGLALVDANARLKQLATTGININGISFTSDFITGGAFSLDGVHPNTRGYAIIANDFIKAINSTYGANVPQVDVADYPTYEVTR